jgi:hypothetical protein
MTLEGLNVLYFPFGLVSPSSPAGAPRQRSRCTGWVSFDFRADYAELKDSNPTRPDSVTKSARLAEGLTPEQACPTPTWSNRFNNQFFSTLHCLFLSAFAFFRNAATAAASK